MDKSCGEFWNELGVFFHKFGGASTIKASFMVFGLRKFCNFAE